MRKRSTLWTPTADVAAKDIADLCSVLYLDETAKKLFALFRGKYSPSQISKRLRDTLKYSRKVVYEKAAQRNERERASKFDRSSRILYRETGDGDIYR